MIKKIIACLTICFIITGIISPVFSYASALPQPNWSDPGISEIINISDLTGWMLNGGTFDVSQYTDAESFMNDYFNARTKTRLISPDETAEDYYEVLPGFGINNQLVEGDSFARPLDTNRVIASSFRDHTGYGRRLSNEVNDALLSTGSLYDTKIPLLNEVEFANFVNYNHDALRLYSEFFNSDTPDTPQTYLPDEYSFYSIIGTPNIGNINVLSSTYSYVGTSNSIMSPNQDISYCGVYGVNLNTSNFYNVSYQLMDPGSYIEINSENNFYRLTEHLNLTGSYYLTYNGSNFNNFSNCRIMSNYIVPWNGAIYSSSYNNITTSFNSITDALNYSYSHYRNISVYVNGVLWILGGYDPSSVPPSIKPEFPDAVGGEDLPSTTWPIFRPRAPYYTSVPGVLQAIEDAISDDGELDIDDLKPYLTDENGNPVPDPIFDPEPVPIPVPDPINPDVVPGLPILPAIPPDMPGFNGVSVLAEIINFTNQSLPTALIVTFWGIVFGIVILGLIKILHK